MKNGFYLSTYMYIDELASVMNLKMRHNQNVSLWKKEGKDIKLIHYWELERISGEKQHSSTFYNKQQAMKIIEKLLKQYNLNISDIVEIWGTPHLDSVDKGSYSTDSEVSYHSICHLFSSMFFNSSNFYNEKMISLAVDSGPDNVVELNAYDKKLYAGSYVDNGEISIFPIKSPGKLWSRAKKEFGLREGTLMALATASKSEIYDYKYDDLFMEEMSSREEVDRVFKNINKILDNLSDKDEGVLFSGYDSNFSIRENKISMAMKIIQNYSNRIMESNIDNIVEKYNVKLNETILSLSGGFALNCPTNSYLMNKYKFKDFIAPPCVNDSGLSLGIALYTFYTKLKNINVNIKHAYYGDFDHNLKENLVEFEKFIKNTSEFDSEIVVEDIINGPIAWFNERTEIGPRALGNRSLLGDPRKKSTKDKLNEIKDREWWRPVAPIVHEEFGDIYFESYRRSPFMLQNFKIKDEIRESIPAIAHIDGTSRIQTVSSEENPLIFEILNKFYMKTGIPIICNTSLNDKGEPIVNTIAETFNFCLRKKISILYINGLRIELYNHHLFSEKIPANRDTEGVFRLSLRDKERLIKELNPYNVNLENLIYYYDNKNIFSNFNLKNIKDVNKLKTLASEYIKQYPLSFKRE